MSREGEQRPAAPDHPAPAAGRDPAHEQALPQKA